MSTVNLPDSFIERAKAITGLSRKDDAVRAVIDLAEAATAGAAKELPVSSLPAAVRESERELRAGKGKRFTSAKAAIKWLKS